MPVDFRPTFRCLAVIGILAAMAVTVPGHAQGSPRSMSDCERLKNDLAYNQCLAMFGPAAKNIAGGDSSRSLPLDPGPLPPADRSTVAGIPDVEEPILAEPSRRWRRARQVRSGGRQSASFDVGSSSGGIAIIEPAPERRSRNRWRRRR